MSSLLSCYLMLMTYGSFVFIIYGSGSKIEKSMTESDKIENDPISNHDSRLRPRENFFPFPPAGPTWPLRFTPSLNSRTRPPDRPPRATESSSPITIHISPRSLPPRPSHRVRNIQNPPIPRIPTLGWREPQIFAPASPPPSTRRPANLQIRFGPEPDTAALA